MVSDDEDAALAETVMPVDEPFGLAMAPTGDLWVSQYDNGDIEVLDPNNGAVLHRFDVGANPTEVSFSAQDQIALLTDEYTSNVVAIDTATDQVLYREHLDGGTLPRVCLNPTGAFAYVLQDDHMIDILNPLTGAITGAIDSGLTRPRGIAFNAEGTFAVVADETENKLSIINVAHEKVVRVVDVGDFPRDVAIADGCAYTANFESGDVSVVNLNTGDLVATVAVGVEPRRIIAYKNRVFVSNQGSNTVSIIDAETQTVERTIATEDGPRALAVNANGTLLYVANYGSDCVTSYQIGPAPDGAQALLASSAACSTTPLIVSSAGFGDDALDLAIAPGFKS